MSIEHSLQNKPASLDERRGAEHAGNVVPLRQDNVFQGRQPPQRSDEFFAVLSPLLEEAAGLRNQSAHQETNDFLVLLEENARLRKLAIQLSNLLGDLPEPSASVRSGPGRERLSPIPDQSKSR
jgi:hypothetical protein